MEPLLCDEELSGYENIGPVLCEPVGDMGQADVERIHVPSANFHVLSFGNWGSALSKSRTMGEVMRYCIIRINRV